MLSQISDWIADTGPSKVIQDVLWIIPAVQSVHILAIAVVMASVWMIDLRILGLAGRSHSISDMANRFVPWIWGALVVLAITGSILLIGEPGRALTNPAFGLKMALLLVAIIVTVTFQLTVRRNVAFWDLSPTRRAGAKLTAIVSLLLWIAIAVCGRWIAYLD